MMRIEKTPVALKLRLNRWIPGSLILVAVVVVSTLSLSLARADEPARVVVALAPLPVPGQTSGMRTASSGWAANQCVRCHQVDPLFSHPVNVAPTMLVPAGLPLQNGLITCTTCHDDSASAHAVARNATTSMLRSGNTGKSGSFCIQCHDPTVSSRQSSHALGLRRAHLQSLTNPAAAIESPKRQGAFDSETQLCLSCHDGIVSTDVNMTRTAFSDSLSQHPVGVSMAGMQSPLADRNSMLQAPARTDARVRLFDNRVGCNSCHSPFSSEKRLLVMPNRNSDLCLICHTN